MVLTLDAPPAEETMAEILSLDGFAEGSALKL